MPVWDAAWLLCGNAALSLAEKRTFLLRGDGG
jgi:hypothetical protein